MSRHSRILMTSAALLLAVGVAGCSSSDNSPTAPSDPSGVEVDRSDSSTDGATDAVVTDEIPQVEVEAIAEVEQELASLDEDLDAIEDALAEVDALLDSTVP